MTPLDSPQAAAVCERIAGDFAPRVQAWQRREGRHGLPWQGTRDPYRIWLSEVMLQQTQVTTVLRYYDRFLREFPTVGDLAQAPQEAVLALWSGLGYYSRARNLHRCAQEVVEHCGGVFPTDAARLEALPGIGRSTAAAIAAFSTGARVAILDANVRRVLARVLAFGEPLKTGPATEQLWAWAERLLPADDMPTYTQGMMDLGATVCLSRKPMCGQCPVQDLCAAAALGTPQMFPVAAPRSARQTLERVWGVWWRDTPQGLAVLLERKPQSGVWAGLWSLPEWEHEDLHSAEVRSASAAAPRDIHRGAILIHHLTHRELRFLPLEVHWGATAPQGQASVEPRQWWALDDALKQGLPAPVRRLLERGPLAGP